MNNFKTGLLTNGGVRSDIICERLLSKGFRFDFIVHTLPLSWYECKRRYKKINLFNPIDLLRVTRFCILNNLKKKKIESTFLTYANKVYFSETLNSLAMEKLLLSLDYDFMVISDVGIIKQNIIDTAKKGILNCHPGLLPFVRGNGVVGRALQRRVAVGATLHYVNAGIDTGDIIARRLLPVKKKYADLREIEIEADELVIELMTEKIAGLRTMLAAPNRIIQTEKYPYCKWLNEEERTALNLAATNDLYHSWLEWCCTGTNDLKDEVMKMP